MKATKRTLLVLAAVLLMVGVLPALAQEPRVSVAQGQLMKVDPSARTIAVRTTQGSMIQFTYTEETRVAGADQGVAGLATMAGADVMVQFVKKGQDNIATQIEVRTRQEGDRKQRQEGDKKH
jgi:hypothetical protein